MRGGRDRRHGLERACVRDTNAAATIKLVSEKDRIKALKNQGISWVPGRARRRADRACQRRDCKGRRGGDGCTDASRRLRRGPSAAVAKRTTKAALVSA